MTNSIYGETAFEKEIEQSLTEKGGYTKVSAAQFSREYCLDTATLIAFLQETQPKEWKKLETVFPKEAETKIIERICREISESSMLQVLRKGVKTQGIAFKLAYFRPETSMNPETVRLYALNRLTVMRQVKYSRSNENSIDMVLSVNGLPTATIELKNHFTGQTAGHAKAQYSHSRDPKELMFQFKRRALVHFAVDPDEAYMTTRISGDKTVYLPFNKGNGTAAGNPLNPGGHKTAYLWEEVWQKDSWMEILSRFVHLESKETFYKLANRTEKKENIVFPRYHQLDVVRKVLADVRQQGAGHKYLVQHSAGSGKSNSIAWLSYRLSTLHDDRDRRIFDSVIVITDRKVLDRQLQDTIYSIDHVPGVVEKIDKDSAQLAAALKDGKQIIITTLQKFPFILEAAKDLPGRRYAVIIDEAHSSQSGDAAKDMKKVLGAKDAEKEAEKEAESNHEGTDDDGLDLVRESLDNEAQPVNISFFAFTATPKAKTVSVFGRKGADGLPRPFHLYSMRQAIQEGFIHDVLQNYTTYASYHRLTKKINDDPEVNKKKATREIGRFVALHSHILAQKTEVIIEHFRQVASKKIGGKAKAMVVTGSRLHAVRYYNEFKKYIKDKNYQNIRALVAFSGKVEDPMLYPDGITEAQLNKFSERELPERFASDEYQLLLVADKYQTGFDQPLLHTMYVDKKLSGVKAVQTLSRLNRTCAGKEDTFVLDFVNEREVILESFQPYYELTTITQNPDPDLLYDQKNRLENSRVFWSSEVEAFCNLFFASPDPMKSGIHARLNAHIDPAVDRFRHLASDEERDEFKRTLTGFIHSYSFLVQILPFQDAELEKLFAFCKFLLRKLPHGNLADAFRLGDEVALEYYRLQKISEGSILLEPQGEYGLHPPTEVGLSRPKDEKEHLSVIINILNDTFGTDFTEADKLFFDQIETVLMDNEQLAQQAQNNSMDNFRFGFEEAFMNALLERMEQNGDIFQKIISDENGFGEVVREFFLKKMYHKFRA